MKRPEAVGELKLVYQAFARDFEAAKRLARAEPSQFSRRTLVLTYFSFVEGIAYQLRQVTLASLQHSDVLSAGELSLLREERFQLTAKGLPEKRDNFSATLPSLLFSLRCYVKNHGASFAPSTGTTGWEAMRHLVEIRDRLTHPKSAADLEVSAGDLDTLTSASAWWEEELVQMFKACGEADAFYRQAEHSREA